MLRIFKIRFEFSIVLSGKYKHRRLQGHWQGESNLGRRQETSLRKLQDKTLLKAARIWPLTDTGYCQILTVYHAQLLTYTYYLYRFTGLVVLLSHFTDGMMNQYWKPGCLTGVCTLEHFKHSVRCSFAFLGASQAALMVQNLPVNAGYARSSGSIPRLGRSLE